MSWSSTTEVSGEVGPDNFLLALSDRLRSIADPVALLYAALEMVGQHLGVNRVGYCDIEDASGTLYYPVGWGDGVLEPLAGRLPMKVLLGDAYIAFFRAGRTAYVPDVDLDPMVLPGSFAAIGTRAFLAVPLIRDGAWVAGLFINQAMTRDWTPDEGALLEGVLARTWEAVERARAETILRSAQRRQAMLSELVLQQRVAVDEDKVMQAASAAVGSHVGASRAGFLRVVDADSIVFLDGWTAGPLPKLNGTMQLALIGSERDALLVGQTISVADTHADPSIDSAGLDALGIRAFIGAPVVRQGRWEVGFYVNHHDPHLWHSDDTDLVREIAEVTWDAVERIRAQAALVHANATLEQRVEERTSELRAAEEALRQSQKMEAVGQLTGGLAHDFNNLLAGISGSLEMMSVRIDQGRIKDIEKYMLAAQGASKRAAALTHRLLAFSRRQTLDPKSTDVNRLVGGMQEMIQRTVGPGIPVEVVGASSLWPALVDPSQLENALLNLCINARDAMPEGGRITVETANKWIDERAARQQDMPEGQYLSLCVTDTGTGMSPEVIARVFEPFFTTKPIGEGTGLGLSMIYGFAKQSGGQVRIYSEIDQGSTVCIYLPRHYGEVVEVESMNKPDVLSRSKQAATVLVVDDEPTVRMLVTDILEDLGYLAVEAGDSAAGLKILQSDVRIDLLVTDVGLPGGMNGRQMADAARVHRPDLRVLFITGYAENAILGNGHLAPGMAVLTKPFVMDTMAARIRSLVEAGRDAKQQHLI